MGRGVARGDADRERFGREVDPAERPPFDPFTEPGEGRKGRGVGKKKAPADAALAAGGLVIVALVVWRTRRHRRHKRAARQHSASEL